MKRIKNTKNLKKSKKFCIVAVIILLLVCIGSGGDSEEATPADTPETTAVELSTAEQQAVGIYDCIGSATDGVFISVEELDYYLDEDYSSYYINLKDDGTAITYFGSVCVFDWSIEGGTLYLDGPGGTMEFGFDAESNTIQWSDSGETIIYFSK